MRDSPHLEGSIRDAGTLHEREEHIGRSLTYALRVGSTTSFLLVVSDDMYFIS
jgi:hypothetical protein